ncbi:lysoplasmalogenase [Gelidibacter salicanalis]|uniref:Lysoplasmalogenase n=1 Tax=Gelidibacter salicanalis TaxID=291193 RepID=A0A934KP23_9FLAO|nr:lysoplasmalogenase [Gelidibacter salicanalis]MBJ7881239.1 lysoplasmalogenase [Gelidibacter salicanalis]
MLSKTDKLFVLIYALLIIAELICGSVDNRGVCHYFTKPSLLISLLFYFYVQSKELDPKTRTLTFLALICSLMGDVLLLFDSRSANYFILGLVSFLLAHLFYSVVFLKKRNSKINPLVLITILSLYALGFFYLLRDGLNDLMMPVIIYMLVILLMVITAYIRHKKVAEKSFILVFFGALLFVISDSILAVNKFYMPIQFSGVYIMLTYALAQYFIVLGVLKQR